MTLDEFDIALMRALQRDGGMTNAALSEKVNLSASQCSRRRAALEAAGLIAGYSARLDAEKLGFGFRAMVRVNLQSHGGSRRWANSTKENPSVPAGLLSVIVAFGASCGKGPIRQSPVRIG